MLNYLESINVGWINTCKSTIYKLKTNFFLKLNHRKKSSKGLIINNSTNIKLGLCCYRYKWLMRIEENTCSSLYKQGCAIAAGSIIQLIYIQCLSRKVHPTCRHANQTYPTPNLIHITVKSVYIKGGKKNLICKHFKPNTIGKLLRLDLYFAS